MSKIQWTDRTDNPLKRDDGGNYCEMISPGCAHCYASGLNSKGTRFGGNGLPYGGVRPLNRPEMTLNYDMLAGWARMRKPKKHFIGSMTDIFGEWVPDKMVLDLFDAMVEAPLQTFQLLTKRPQRAAHLTAKWIYTRKQIVFPKNVWLGTSAEDQKRLDERLLWLIGSPVQVRFLSLEPLLGPIQFPGLNDDNPFELIPPMNGIHWVIVGGESGPNARPMDLAWVEDISKQCAVEDTPLFIKQLGSHWAKQNGAKHRKGGDIAEWPKHLRIRVFPDHSETELQINRFGRGEDCK